MKKIYKCVAWLKCSIIAFDHNIFLDAETGTSVNEYTKFNLATEKIHCDSIDSQLNTFNSDGIVNFVSNNAPESTNKMLLNSNSNFMLNK